MLVDKDKALLLRMPDCNLSSTIWSFILKYKEIPSCLCLNYQSVLARLIKKKSENFSIAPKTLEFSLKKETFRSIQSLDWDWRNHCLGVNEVEESTLNLRADSHQQETEEQEKKNPEEETGVRGMDQTL